MAEGPELEFDTKTRFIGVMIAVMAAILSIVEAAGNNAAQDALRGTVEASDTWAFYQAKTIRMTTLKTEAKALELQMAGMEQGPQLDAVKATLAEWSANAKRYDSEPESGEGRKELAAKAKSLVAERDRAAAANETYDFASSALQLGILLASTAVVTSITWLAWLGAGLGAIGTLLGLLGYFAPQMLGG